MSPGPLGKERVLAGGGSPSLDGAGRVSPQGGRARREGTGDEDVAFILANEEGLGSLGNK